MFFFVLLINMMRSRVPNHIQAVPESASERDMRIRTVANPAGSVVPEPCASTLPVGRAGGQADRRTKQQARGQPAPGAMCFRPSAHPLPRWHHLRWPPTEPGRPRHCRPHWTGLPQVQGQASWLPAPAPRGCAGPGCDEQLHTAGPCPWNLLRSRNLHALVLSVHGCDAYALLTGLVDLHLCPKLGVEDQSQAALGPHH